MTDTVFEDHDPVTYEAWTTEPGENGDSTRDESALLLKYKPEGADLSLYIDYDNNFIVIYSVIEIRGNKYHINDFRKKTEDKEVFPEIFILCLRSFLETYKLNQSKYFPTLFTMPALYTDDILNFLLKAIPCLMKVAKIYYTPQFKRIKIKRSLNISMSCAGRGIDQYLSCAFAYDPQISPDDIQAMIDALKGKEELQFYQLRRGGFVDLRSAKVLETLAFLQKFGVTLEDLRQRKMNIPECDLPYAADLLADAEAKAAIEFTGTRLRSIEQSIFNSPKVSLELPRTLRADLRPYQQIGFRWMKTLLCARLGGILADDMGLGKTLQAIALVLSALEQAGHIKVLVVVPTSLIDNWVSEFTRFAPSITCLSVTGSPDKRNDLLQRALDDYQVIVTSYGLALNDISVYKDHSFDVLFLDEAQKVKNRLSKTTAAIRKIQATSTFALTGTPVENNLAELWSIFSLILPPLLKDYKSFERKYINENENLEELRQRISPFVLRRMKQDVLAELPEKTETTLRIELSDSQKKLYLAYREQALGMLGEARSIVKILPILTRLRQICCHPGMFIDDYAESTGKLEVLIDTLSELRDEGRRALVFSQFTSMLDIIQKELVNHDLEYCRLDGSTPQNLRSEIVRDFTEGNAPVFLISLKAGGVGLNLTPADTVIHFDPWWNPSVEDQASARIHRIGQDKCVQIIYLIAQGTIEEKINDVKQEKRELIAKLIQPEGESSIIPTIDELRRLL